VFNVSVPPSNMIVPAVPSEPLLKQSVLSVIVVPPE